MGLLHHRIVGDGEPLLLIHGWGVTLSLWTDLEPLLSPLVRLIEIELPGMGESPPPNQVYVRACVEALTTLRRALNVTKWTVLSYSAGTAIGANYIRCDAEHVRAAIFLCPILPLGLWPLIDGVGRMVDRHCARLGTWVISGWRLRWMIGLLGFNQLDHPGTKDWFHEISTQPMKTLRAHLLGALDHDWDYLPAAIPISWIWGSADRLAVRPRGHRQGDRTIDSAHAAPVLAAPAIAREVLAVLHAKCSPF
jgi:pimeloyl-ACP methyl ester carboxylesterase